MRERLWVRIQSGPTGPAQPIFGSGPRKGRKWINPTAFAAPPAYTFGNVGRNSVYGPSLQTLDVGVVRLFNLTERLKFESRGEFFNALNHTNYGTPNRFVNPSGFGNITSVMTPGRQIQVSARILF